MNCTQNRLSIIIANIHLFSESHTKYQKIINNFTL